jgi:hypothetical protein
VKGGAPGLKSTCPRRDPADPRKAPNARAERQKAMLEKPPARHTPSVPTAADPHISSTVHSPMAANPHGAGSGSRVPTTPYPYPSTLPGPITRDPEIEGAGRDGYHLNGWRRRGGGRHHGPRRDGGSRFRRGGLWLRHRLHLVNRLRLIGGHIDNSPLDATRVPNGETRRYYCQTQSCSFHSFQCLLH